MPNVSGVCVVKINLDNITILTPHHNNFIGVEIQRDSGKNNFKI